MQIGQGESLVHFFVSGFAKSPAPDRSSGKRWAGRIISNALCWLLNNATQRADTGQELRLMKTLKRRKQYIVFLY